jgi:hypothetical protein
LNFAMKFWRFCRVRGEKVVPQDPT